MSNLIPDGVYRGRVTRGEPKVSTKKGTEFYELTGEITEEGPYKGRRASHAAWMNTKENAERSMKTLLAAGWDGDDPIALGGLGSVEVDFVIEIEEPQINEKTGEPFAPKNRIAFINEVGASATGRSMNDGERSKFGSRLAALKASMGITKTARPPITRAMPPNAPSAGQDPNPNGNGAVKAPF